MPKYTIEQLADRVGGQLLGTSNLLISGVDQIDAAGPGQITFIRDHRHASHWQQSVASAALVSDGVELEPGPGRSLICVKDADQAMAIVLDLFAPPPPTPDVGIHASAVVDPTAHISATAAIGPYCVIAKRVRIGEGCILHAHVTVLDDCVLGSNCVLFPGTVIYDRCQLGTHVITHANTVIGADGFGYHPAPDGSGLPIKIPQIGSVKIGNHVEIGAGSCIDRGKFSATTIGDGTKIDNLCQIAHNCQIGRCCILAGQVGLAGSVTLGDGVVMGGQAGAADHITIGAGAKIAARAAVLSDVPNDATWFGHPARHIQTALREIASLRRLPGLVKMIRRQNRSQDSPNPQQADIGPR